MKYFCRRLLITMSLVICAGDLQAEEFGLEIAIDSPAVTRANGKITNFSVPLRFSNSSATVVRIVPNKCVNGFAKISFELRHDSGILHRIRRRCLSQPKLSEILTIQPGAEVTTKF